MPRNTVIFVMLALLTFVMLSLAACGQAEPDHADTPAGPLIIEPEQLISKEDSEELLGEAVKDGEKSEQPAVGQKICFYDMPYRDSAYFIQISVTQTTFMSNANQKPEDIYMTLKKELTETADQKKIDGVGDEYFFGTPGLHILKDGYYLCIAAGNMNDERVLDRLERAGALAVKNLENILSEVE
jgi:predicted small lipoprotein YifL